MRPDVSLVLLGMSHWTAAVDTRGQLAAGKALLVSRLAVPGNIPGEVSLLPGITLVGLDELDSGLDENVEKRKVAVPRLECTIENEAETFVSGIGGARSRRQARPVRRTGRSRDESIGASAW